jgi:hypothetical protein
MFTQTALFALAALSTLTSAITVTNPNRQTIWDSGKSNTITWTKVSTDPSSFDIYLSHMVGGSSPLNTLLFSDVSSDKGSVVVEGLQLPTGNAYQINLVAHDKPEQIYAQSNQFNVTGEAVEATSTVEGYTGPTYTPSASKNSDDSKTSSKQTTLVTSTASSNATVTASGTASSTTTGEANETSGSDSEGAETTESSTGTGTTASSSATSTPNAAAGNVATGSLAAFVFGAIALFA